jgi:hypothetical protein
VLGDEDLPARSPVMFRKELLGSVIACNQVSPFH